MSVQGESWDADLLRDQGLGRQDARQLQRGLPPVRGNPGAGRRRVLHRRPALDHDRVRARGAPRGDTRGRGHALRDRHRPGAIDRLRAEPCEGACGGGVAAQLRDELRRAPAHDAVQGQVGRPGVRLGGPLHVPRPDGRRHPPLPDRHRPDRRRPAAASRADARCRRTLQRPLRPDVHGSERRLPGGRGAGQEPAGARAVDVDIRRETHRASSGSSTSRTSSGRSSRPR